MPDPSRRLVAILAGDVVGYSAMMERNEAAVLADLFALERQIVEPSVNDHGGRVFKTTGDGFLAEFASVAGAVEAAIEMQESMASRVFTGEPIALRIGVNLGDVVDRQGDLYGDGVNLAARLESAAQSGGIMISEAVHSPLPEALRRRFSPSGPLELKNITRDVRGWRWPSSAEASSSARGSDERSTLAVLPFSNLSGNPHDDHFASGLTEDLTMALSRFHWFMVTARSSTIHFGSSDADIARAEAALQARYVVIGGVRVAGNRVRVTARLLDNADDRQIWSDRYDRELKDIFEVQDDITAAIVGAAIPHLISSVRRPSSRRADFSSWQLAMQGIDLMWRSDLANDQVVAARDLLEQALDIDHDNTTAMLGLAFSLANPYFYGGIERDLDRARELAQRAIAIDDTSALAWAVLAMTDIYAGLHESAERLLHRAIALNPNLAVAHGLMSLEQAFRMNVDKCDAAFHQMQRLSPRDPLLTFYEASRAMARIGVGDYRAALTIIEPVLVRRPTLMPAWRIQAVAQELLGHHEDAVESVRRLLQLGPVTVEWMRRNLAPFEDPDAMERYYRALAAAGVPQK